MKSLSVILGLVIVALFSDTDSFASESDGGSSKTFVLVHGAWGGGWDWKGVADRLEAKGHTAYRPTLTGLGERSHLVDRDVTLSTHIQDIENVIKFEQLNRVVLVGHSYGGMVITGVAHKIPVKVEQLIYIDAILPEDGESLLSLGDGETSQRFREAIEAGDKDSLAPWWEPGRDVPHPLGTVSEKLVLKNPAAIKIPGYYILTVDPEVSGPDAFAKYLERAKARNWPTSVMPTHHCPQRSMPDELVELLINASKQ